MYLKLRCDLPPNRSVALLPEGAGPAAQVVHTCCSASFGSLSAAGNGLFIQEEIYLSSGGSGWSCRYQGHRPALTRTRPACCHTLQPLLWFNMLNMQIRTEWLQLTWRVARRPQVAGLVARRPQVAGLQLGSCLRNSSFWFSWF